MTRPSRVQARTIAAGRLAQTAPVQRSSVPTRATPSSRGARRSFGASAAAGASSRTLAPTSLAVSETGGSGVVAIVAAAMVGAVLGRSAGAASDEVTGGVDGDTAIRSKTTSTVRSRVIVATRQTSLGTQRQVLLAAASRQP